MDTNEEDFDQYAKDLAGTTVHAIAIYIAVEGGMSYSEAMSIIARTCCRLIVQSLGEKPFAELERVDGFHELGTERIREWFDCFKIDFGRKRTFDFTEMRLLLESERREAEVKAINIWRENEIQ